MPQWNFVITPEAEADLNKLDAVVRKRILAKLKWFADNFDYVTPFPLGEPFKGFFKLRVGAWRIIYDVEYLKSLVAVHYIDRRDKIYRVN